MLRSHTQRCRLMILTCSLPTSLQSRFQDSVLGKIQVPVADVARNGSLKDTWALQDAESGTLEMKLQWCACLPFCLPAACLTACPTACLTACPTARL
jgi:hypothetical protein